MSGYLSLSSNRRVGVLTVTGLLYIWCFNGAFVADLCDAELPDSLVQQNSSEMLDRWANFVAGEINGSAVSERCLQEMNTFMEGIANQETWAKRMLDATAKPPSGILEGNMHWLGSYDECLSTTAPAGTEGEPGFDAHYCAFSKPIPMFGGNDTNADRVNFLGISPNFEIGLCVPAHCNASDVEHLVQEGLQILPFNVSDILDSFTPQCKGRLDLAEDSAAIAVTIICSLLACILLFGTLYDIAFVRIPIALSTTHAHANGFIRGESDRTYSQSQGETIPLLAARLDAKPNLQPRSLLAELLLSFSILTNAERLLNTRQNETSLKCINGIRVLSITWVILGHSILITMGSSANLNHLLDLLKSFTFSVVSNGTFSVDTFFLLSGFLVTFLILREMRECNGRIGWHKVYFHRFWRLTPPYMLVLMYAFVFPYWSDGPLWQYKEYADTVNCKLNWWTNLLYVNNLVNYDKLCMAWSWYLSNDMQFFIISPLVIIALYFVPVVGIAILTSLLLTHIIANAVSTHVYNAAPLVTDLSTAMVYFEHLYLTPWCRVGSYAVGMATGYIVYRSERRLILPKFVVVFGWIMATGSALAVLYGLNGYLASGTSPDINVSALYNALARPVWAMAVAWVILACSNGYGGIVNTILSVDIFVPLARLTYCTYLVHPIVILYMNMSRRVPYYTCNLTMIYEFLGSLVLSYGVAFCVSMAIEAPALQLEKLFLPKKREAP